MARADAAREAAAPRDPPRLDATVEAETARCVRSGLAAMAVATLLLVVFNSASMRIWARNLPGNAATDIIVSYADRWHALMQGIGTTLPKAAVQDAVAGLRDFEWTDSFDLGRERAANLRKQGEPRG